MQDQDQEVIGEMAVKIVTDSGADLPPEIVKALDITVVPVYVYFGNEAYRDGVDMGPDELYQRLEEGSIHPTTTQPMPVDFEKVYRELSREADEIVSIHLSSKVSGTYNSAVQGKEMIETKGTIEVIDSFSLSMGLGLITMTAARAAQSGGTLQEVIDETRNAMRNTRLLAVLDSLKYLLAGGRITKARATIGSILNVKPVLTLQDGEIIQAGLTRSYQKGIEKLYEFVKNTPNIEDVSILHSTVPEEAELLKQRISAFIKPDRIHMARLGAGLGVHGGPGTLIVSLRQSS
jgi:DegV family protein with EDD domain